MWQKNNSKISWSILEERIDFRIHILRTDSGGEWKYCFVLQEPRCILTAKRGEIALLWTRPDAWYSPVDCRWPSGMMRFNMRLTCWSAHPQTLILRKFLLYNCWRRKHPLFVWLWSLALCVRSSETQKRKPFHKGISRTPTEGPNFCNHTARQEDRKFGCWTIQESFVQDKEIATEKRRERDEIKKNLIGLGKSGGTLITWGKWVELSRGVWRRDDSRGCKHLTRVVPKKLREAIRITQKSTWKKPWKQNYKR